MPHTPIAGHARASRAALPAGAPALKRAPSRRFAARRWGWDPRIKAALVVGAAIVVLAVIFLRSTTGRLSSVSAQAGQYPYQVASPKSGQVAPSFNLPATTGGTISLAAFQGKTVLLYFQEGIGCEGCWTQLKDIQTHFGQFEALGIDAVITITTNPLDALQQKVADEGITLPVLADTSFAVSQAYDANAYGMMSGSADGHTFLVVGPDGRIRWRADYGGPPNYTMYVPIPNLLADLREGLHATS
jgi:peroxiredoxin Q/BCP